MRQVRETKDFVQRFHSDKLVFHGTTQRMESVHNANQCDRTNRRISFMTSHTVTPSGLETLMVKTSKTCTLSCITGISVANKQTAAGCSLDQSCMPASSWQSHVPGLQGHPSRSPMSITNPGTCWWIDCTRFGAITHRKEFLATSTWCQLWRSMRKTM